MLEIQSGRLTALASPRLQAAATVFVLLLQRTPVLKLLVEADVRVAAGVPQILRSAVVAAVSLGACDTLSGATTFVSNPSSPANASQGEGFGLVFSIIGSESAGGGAGSWTIYGPLPPGLSILNAVEGPTNTFSLNQGSGAITGTPTETGSWDVTFKAWEKANQTGEPWNPGKLGPYPVVTIVVSATGELVFTSQPMSASVSVGSTFNVGVTTSGTPAPTLQWRKNGEPIEGATNEIFSIAAVATDDAGDYDVVATNTNGSVTSDIATLTVAVAPQFTTQPFSQTVLDGGAASFSVVAVGSPAPTYQWRKNGGGLVGATNETITIATVTAGDAGDYTVVATNTSGSITSEIATLTVTSAPQITTQPIAQAAAEGASASFSVVATGSPAPTYQWRKNGGAIVGATNQNFSIAAVSANDAGDYDVVATNTIGSIASDIATLTVTSVPQIVAQPIAQSVLEGASVSFSVVATGLPVPTYQWLKDGLAIPGATDAVYAIVSVSAAHVGSYTVFIQNSEGSVTSAAVELTLQSGPPVIAADPQSQSVIPGAGATFIVDVDDEAGLSFQWLKDGVALAGATGSILNLENVRAADEADYSVEVSNGLGSTTSGVASLSILASGFSRLSNLSTRTRIDAGAVLIPGFAVEGSGQATLMARAVGPTLGSLGVVGAIDDPQFRLMSGQDELFANDNWEDGSNRTELEAIRVATGAFALDAGSADAALAVSLDARPYTLPTTGVSGATGVVLIELYDGGERGPDQPRLVNLSARSQVGMGADKLIPGFVIDGNVAKTLLIRAVGPTLSDFGVGGVLENPLMRLFSTSGELASNDDWGSGFQTAAIAAVAGTVGAFPIDPSSADAALLITLNPGPYTVQVSGVGDTTGVCLVEVYEVPPVP